MATRVAPRAAAISAKRPAPQPASSTHRPRRSLSVHPVSASNRRREIDVPFTESSCTSRNMFHCCPKDAA